MTVRRMTHETLRFELSLVRKLCESIDTPRSLAVAILIRNDEFEQLLNLDFEPSRYDSAGACADDYLVTKILSKNPRLPLFVDPEEVAIRKFWAAEKQCFETNSRLLRMNEGLDFPDPDIMTATARAAQRISTILGPLTRSKLSFAEKKMRFGPGATTSLSGVVTAGKKYSRRNLDVTPRALSFRTFAFPVTWRGNSDAISLRKSSKLRVVPKKADCGRVILIEPDLNIYVQLGFGALIRKQLANYGLDLQTQVNNQQLAREGSIDDQLVTMDLSSASDCICREVVWSLLPYDWADALHFSRVDYVEHNGEEHELQKWSGMGNGYTFELETLIFYGILLGCAETLGCCEDKILAYGDDLIFPVQMESLVTRTLEFLGFSVNHEKTFGKGRFRESCGADWFDGINVRPVYLRSEHHDPRIQSYTYANILRRWAHRRNGGGSCDARCLPAWLTCYTRVPRQASFRIPDGFGEVGFISSFDEASSNITKAGHGWGGYHFRFLNVEPHRQVVDIYGAYLNALQVPTDFMSGVESLRGRYGRTTTGKGYVLTWPNLGPWL